MVDASGLDRWHTESLRVTAFPDPTAAYDPTNWWSQLVGNIPEQRVDSPRQGTRQDAGPFSEGQLVLAVQPSRIDWVFAPAEQDPREISTFPSLGPLNAARRPFEDLVCRWLPEAPPLRRLAFGAALNQPAASRAEAYRLLSKYLGTVQLDTENSSDFSYQINRPRNSATGILGLRVNRLAKWSGVALKLSSISSAAAGSVTFSDQLLANACRLELDISTVPGNPELLPGNNLGLLFQELVRLGLEIAGQGDIP